MIGFLSFRQSYLFGFDAASDDLAFPTLRSWKMVSNLLDGISEDMDTVYPLIAGVIGSGATIEFLAWATVYRELPEIKDIFDGKMLPVPQKPDALYALISSMTAYARDHKDDLSQIANSVRYAEQMPPDYSAVLMWDYMHLEPDYKLTLMKIPVFSRWLRTKRRLLNGVL